MKAEGSNCRWKGARELRWRLRDGWWMIGMIAGEGGRWLVE